MICNFIMIYIQYRDFLNLPFICLKDIAKQPLSECGGQGRRLFGYQERPTEYETRLSPCQNASKDIKELQFQCQFQDFKCIFHLRGNSALQSSTGRLACACAGRHRIGVKEALSPSFQTKITLFHLI